MTALLTGKTILIIGASSGIGESAAHLFAREGASYVTGMTLGVDGGTAPWPH